MKAAHHLARAVRRLRRDPASALASAAVLALGIGAAVSVFAVLSAVLLRPLPYAHPDRLVVVDAGGGAAGTRIAAPEAAAFAGAAAIGEVGYLRDVRDGVLADDDGADAVRVGTASPSLFHALGIRPVAGRLLDPVVPPAAVGEPTGGGEALVSHQLWRERFGGTPDIIGTALRLDGEVVTVVGVLPADFRLALPPAAGLPDGAGIWLPLPVPLEDFRRPDRLRDQDSDNRGVVIARLAEGATAASAAAELATIRRRLAAARGEADHDGSVLRVVPLAEAATATARPLLLVLFGAVLLVLVLTSANVAGLLLARAAGRGPELAVRAALGASRGMLTAMVAAEGAVIGAGAGVLGLILSFWGRDALVRLGPASLADAGSVGLDGRVLSFALLTTVAASVLSTAVPAFRAGTPALLSSLRGSAGRSASGASARARRGLVITEIALSVALLSGAGLLGRTLLNLRGVDAGFDAAPVTTFDLALVDAASYRGPADRGRFVRALVDLLEAEPGIAAAGVIAGLPLSGEAFTQPWGRPGEPPEAWSGEANFRVVSDDYFDAVGTPLLAGRAFQPGDDRQDIRVVVVDRRLAERIAPGGDAVGRAIALPLDGRAETARVVGVVSEVRFEGLRTPGRPTLYVPYRHEASRRITVVVRSTDGRPVPRTVVTAALARIDDRLPLFAYAPMSEHVRRATADTRFALAVLAGFAALAALLSAVGIYALMAGSVRGRTAEIGIRMAVGADSSRVARLILREALGLLGPALVAGVGAAAVVAFGARSLLFDVAPLDPLVFGAVAVLVAATALSASWIPARRAARLSPLTALRT